jgi:hypothetical protein
MRDELLRLIREDEEVRAALQALTSSGHRVAYAELRYSHGRLTNQVHCPTCRRAMPSQFTYCGNCGVHISLRNLDNA